MRYANNQSLHTFFVFVCCVPMLNTQTKITHLIANHVFLQSCMWYSMQTKNYHEIVNILYLSMSHLNPAHSVNFLRCMHTRRGEVNLLFEHCLAHVSVVYGQASRGKFKDIWTGWPVMLFSVGERVCHSDLTMQVESYDIH